MRFVSPNGSPIIGTLERITGRANADEYSETGEPEYLGGTEIFWDGQETVCRKVGNKVSLVYLSEDGEEYTFDQLTPGLDDEAAPTT